MRRYRLPCAFTIAYLLIITGCTLYISTVDPVGSGATALAIIILLIIGAASCATAWSWHRADRGA